MSAIVDGMKDDIKKFMLLGGFIVAILVLSYAAQMCS